MKKQSIKINYTEDLSEMFDDKKSNKPNKPNKSDKSNKSKIIYYKLKGGVIPDIIEESTLSVSYLDKLKSMYPTCKHDYNGTTIKPEFTGKYVTTYGEMNYDGIELLAQKYKDVNCFMDIGSGRGKLVLYMASKPYIQKSVGIELVTERHNDAMLLKEALSSYPESNKVKFIEGDILPMDLSVVFSDVIPNPTDVKLFIWISNLCFPIEFTEKVFNKIVESYPSGTIVACSKGVTIDKLVLLDSVKIPMSWSKESIVTVYKINK